MGERHHNRKQAAAAPITNNITRYTAKPSDPFEQKMMRCSTAIRCKTFDRLLSDDRQGV